MFMASSHYYLSLNRHRIHSKNPIDAPIHFYHPPIDRHRFHFPAIDIISISSSKQICNGGCNACSGVDFSEISLFRLTFFFRGSE